MKAAMKLIDNTNVINNCEVKNFEVLCAILFQSMCEYNKIVCFFSFSDVRFHFEGRLKDREFYHVLVLCK